MIGILRKKGKRSMVFACLNDGDGEITVPVARVLEGKGKEGLTRFSGGTTFKQSIRSLPGSGRIQLVYCRPQILLHRDTGKPKISIILIDWGVRESFHSLEYLSRQTAKRDDYELIWLEFYDRKPEALQRLVAKNERILDKWYVVGYPDNVIFHKHRLYNAGILAARGEVCVICDSDAIYQPTFIDRLIGAFEETPRAVIHLDQVRNDNHRFYPFNYPEIEEIFGPGIVNWDGTTTLGMVVQDRIHGANYGACMAARRRDLLAIGGADEHLDYLGYICGPYDLTFRLINYHGRPERWLQNEYLYHVWHPNTSGVNTDYKGPNDARGMSLRALHARASRRIRPYLRNPWIGRTWSGRSTNMESFFSYLKTRQELTWEMGRQPKDVDSVYWAERDYLGYNIFAHAGKWYAVTGARFHPSRAAAGGYRELVMGTSMAEVQAEIRRRGPGRSRHRFFSQPLQHLPVRVWRKSRRLLASLWEKSLW
jgi:hypothetical protein